MNSSDDRTTMLANGTNLADVYTNITASYECEEPYPNQKEILSSVSWWLDGFVQIIIGCLGFAGNAIAIPVLSSRKLSSIFNRILVFLAGIKNQRLFDNVQLIFYEITNLDHSDEIFVKEYYFQIKYYFYQNSKF